MYSFRIEYSNKKYYDMENVNRVDYISVIGEDISVTGEKLLTHKYPLGLTLHLYSDRRTYTTEGENIVSIEVVKID